MATLSFPDAVHVTLAARAALNQLGPCGNDQKVSGWGGGGGDSMSPFPVLSVNLLYVLSLRKQASQVHNKAEPDHLHTGMIFWQF